MNQCRRLTGRFRLRLYGPQPAYVQRQADSPSLSPRRLGRGCCQARSSWLLTYAISAFRNDFLSRRATDRKNELLDGLSETVFAVATGYKIRRPLHFGAGIAHCNTETAALKHRDVILTVADGDDLRQRNL